MKTSIILLFCLLLSLSSFSQSDNQIVKVSNDIELLKISDNVYIHISYYNDNKFGRFSSNGLIYIDQQDAFLFDTPCTDSLTEVLCLWIKNSMKLNLKGFVPNHWHQDCMGGLGYLQKQHITSFANEMTIEIAKSKALPVPEKGFKDSIEIKLNDKIIKCYYLGAAHSLDNIIVWLPSEKILFPGCIAKTMSATNLGNTVDGSLTDYPTTLKKIISKFPDSKIVVPGHGLYGGKDLLEHTLRLCSENK